jgi:hypothetical protein
MMGRKQKLVDGSEYDLLLQKTDIAIYKTTTQVLRK